MYPKNKIILFLFVTVVSYNCNAQNFNYSFSSSSSTYTPLVDSVCTTINDAWSGSSTIIPIGFSINVAGSSFDSLTLNPNGLISFGYDQKINFACLLKDFFGDINSEGLPISSILLQNTGSVNQELLKIEFRNVSFTDADSNKISLSFQLWLKKETNAIEFHMGNVIGLTNNESCTLGLININNTVDNEFGFLLSNNPENPSASKITSGGNSVSLNNLPSVNKVYSFVFSGN